jgi:2',3'-cyclic-nucleotide 2'-phosphodiesterase (5'-nucleotidase family)
MPPSSVCTQKGCALPIEKYNRKTESSLTICIYSPDPDVVEALKPWKEIVDAEGSHVIGSTKVFLDASNDACRKGECNIGNVITDAFVDEVTPTLSSD